MKNIEKERKARAKVTKRALLDLNVKTKKKKAKKVEIDDSGSEGSEISLHESSTSLIDNEETDCEEFEISTSGTVTTENIKDNCFILVKFDKKGAVVYYVGKVIRHYSSTEFKVSYLRKKPGSSWSFVFPNVTDEHRYCVHY